MLEILAVVVFVSYFGVDLYGVLFQPCVRRDGGVGVPAPVEGLLESFDVREGLDQVVAAGAIDQVVRPGGSRQVALFGGCRFGGFFPFGHVGAPLP